MQTIARTLFAIILAVAAFVSAAHAEKVNITFLLTSDIYNFDANQDGRGGFARLNTVVKSERAKGGHVIYVHAGDMISPSLLSGIDKGANTTALLNLAAPDVFVPGNHEFDFGPDIFRTRMKEIHSKLLGANLRDGGGSPVMDIAASEIVDVGGVRVGIVGAVNEETPIESSPGPDFKFLPAVENSEKEAAVLRKAGADLVVVVGHTDRSDDEAMLASHVVDLVLSGHDHILDVQYDGRSALAESMTEAYYVTAVDLTIDIQEKDGKRTVTWWPEFRVIDTQGVAPDPETQAAVDKFNAELSKELDVVIGTSSTALDSRKASVRTMETAIGDLIADASRDAVGADIAITNGGGIRGNKEYPAGTKLTRKDIFAELPFGNKNLKLEVTGDMIWAALENGFGEVENAAGRFPQVSGLVVEADFKQPKGSRVISVIINGKPLYKAATYTLATNDFMAAGGDGYAMFKSAKNLIDPMGAKLLASAVIDYVTAKKDIAPAVEGRIKPKM